MGGVDATETAATGLPFLQGGWCFRLVRWVKREQVKAAAGPAPDFDDSSWADNLGDL